MQWELLKSDLDNRTYVNKQTSTEVSTKRIYTDKLGANWWAFNDLAGVPYIRKAFSQSITNLYQVGLSPKDLKEWTTKIKTLARSTDPEKYEKIYAEIIDIETTISSVVDPLKQNLALATVYVLADDERIDYFNYDVAASKLSRWRLDPDCESFFLTWLSDRIGYYMKLYERTTQTVLSKAKAKEIEL